MISIGDLAAEHRQTCAIKLLIVEYSCADVLDPLQESYPGPASKPRKGHMRRIEWNCKDLALNSKAPVTGSDVKALGAEIGDAVTLQMFREPHFATMRLGAFD